MASSAAAEVPVAAAPPEVDAPDSSPDTVSDATSQSEEGPRMAPYYAFKCSISNLWRASVIHQSVRQLQLVRIRQANESGSIPRTTLASLPPELFQLIVTEIRDSTSSGDTDSFPFLQICQCGTIDTKTIWSQVITLVQFNAWILQKGFDKPFEKVSDVLESEDIAISRLWRVFEETEEFKEIAHAVKLHAYESCGICYRVWIARWLYLSGRRSKVTCEKTRQAKALVDGFLRENGLATIIRQDEEDWCDDGAGEEPEYDIQFYSMTITPKQHVGQVKKALFGHIAFLSAKGNTVFPAFYPALHKFAHDTALLKTDKPDPRAWESLEVLDWDGTGSDDND